MVETLIYVGWWNEEDYVFALSYDRAKLLILEHYAYGDPLHDKYAMGNTWATAPENAGWRIVERKIATPIVFVEISEGVDHVLWECPFCRNSYSDEWRPDDHLPILVTCGCNEMSKYLLGLEKTTGPEKV
jgi:hypothetical protein